jgi:hypothetical protein
MKNALRTFFESNLMMDVYIDQADALMCARHPILVLVGLKGNLCALERKNKKCNFKHLAVDTKYYRVFQRPGCIEFLESLIANQRITLAFYSSKIISNIEPVVEHITRHITRPREEILIYD